MEPTTFSGMVSLLAGHGADKMPWGTAKLKPHDVEQAVRDVATQLAAQRGSQRRLSTEFRETSRSTGAAAGDGDREAIFG